MFAPSHGTPQATQDRQHGANDERYGADRPKYRHLGNEANNKQYDAKCNQSRSLLWSVSRHLAIVAN
jgi:hypothetical protein